jgi:hypothetical protein
MKRLVLALELCLSLIVSAHSQGGMGPAPGTVHSVGGGGFVGACDGVAGATCIAYYSANGCATAAYSGNVIDVVDTATGNTTGTRLQCSGGTVSALVSGSACTFVTGNACSALATTCAVSCSVSTLYNQSGTATLPDLLTPGTVANSETISLSLLNSQACFTSNGSQTVQATITGTVSQPYTMATIVEQTGNFAVNGRLISSNADGTNVGYRGSGIWGSQSGTLTASASISTFHALQAIYNGASSLLVTDGSASATGNFAALALTADIKLLSSSAVGPGGTNVTGSMCEAVVYNSALNSTQYAAYNSNARLSNRWGSSF